MKNFWNNLITESNTLENSYLYKEYFTKPIFDESVVKKILLSSLLESTNSTSSLKRPGTRVYINNNTNDAFLNCLKENLPYHQESIRDYFLRMMGNKDYCVIIHHAEYFDEEVTQFAHRIMAPLLEKYGTPQITFECGFIIGDYKNTPFGVHHDTNGRTIHFNLGPHEKYMYTWDRSEVWEIAGIKKAGYTDPVLISKLLSKATVHKLNDKDLFFLPIHQYHFASTDGFSIDFVITFEKNNLPTIIRKSLAHMNARIVDNEEDYKDSNRELCFSKNDELWLQTVIQEYSLKLQSNLGIVVPPKKRNFDFKDDLFDSNLKISRYNPFPLLLIKKDNYLQVFSRGYIITISDSIEIIKFISGLNDGQIFPLREVKFLKQQFHSEDSFYKFIQKLYESGSVLIS